MDATTLLQQLSAAQTEPGGMAALWDRIGADDPTLRAVAEFMRRRAEAPPAVTESPENPRLAARYRRLRGAYDQLYALVTELARAVGACPRCWGSGAECTLCNGNGAPGSRRPDEDAFDRYVLPALRHLRPALPIADPGARTLTGVRHLPELSPQQEI